MSFKQEIERIESLREAFRSYLLEIGDELAAAAPPAAQPAPAAPPTAPAQQQQATPDQAVDPLAQQQQPGASPEYTAQQFVDDLNKIRGGRSFDDQDVFQQITTMFANIDPTSKETIRTILGQLESIVTPAQQGQQPQAGAQQQDAGAQAVQDTQMYNANINAAPGQPPAPPASFAAPTEAPPA